MQKNLAAWSLQGLRAVVYNRSIAAKAQGSRVDTRGVAGDSGAVQ